MTEQQPLALAQLIRQWQQHDPDREVLTFVDARPDGSFAEQRRTFGQLWANGQRLAHWLRGQGMRQGDSFALIMHNHAEFVDLMVASAILGTLFVPIDPRTRGDKLRYMLDHAECKGAIVAGYTLAEVHACWDTSEHWIATVGTADSTCPRIEDVQASSVAHAELAIVSADLQAPMQLLYTSGTTGDPKAIVSTYARFALSASLPAVLGLNPEDRPYTGLSLTHANAQIITLGMCLHSGMRGVISRKFTRSRLWDITRAYDCTFFNLLGGMTTAIYAEPERDNDADNPVRRILSAGMPAAIWRDFERRFDVELFEFYGAAEGGLTFNPPGVGPLGSCGQAPPSLQLAILDERGQLCAPGQPGEICFRHADGSCPPLHYKGNAPATAEKLAGGWLHMGDIGHVDEAGWLFFHHRSGGGIRKNGDFINPASIDKALCESDAVSDVYTYGLAVAEGLAPGEKNIVAAVVPADHATPDIAGMYASCRATLARHNMPDYIQILPAIPKTASEKPQERYLAQAFTSRPDTTYAINDDT